MVYAHVYNVKTRLVVGWLLLDGRDSSEINLCPVYSACLHECVHDQPCTASEVMRDFPSSTVGIGDAYPVVYPNAHQVK
jgi:hypothetical protein